MIFGPFRRDAATESVWRDAEEIRLRPKTFALLRYLAEHPRRLVTKEELLDAVWPEVAVGDAALAVCIGEIRRALGDDARTPRFIETVHRRGYHLGRGDFQRTIALLRQSAELLHDQPAHERFGQIGLPAVFWRTWLIFSLAEIGAFSEAITCGDEAVRIADASDQPFSLDHRRGGRARRGSAHHVVAVATDDAARGGVPPRGPRRRRPHRRRAGARLGGAPRRAGEPSLRPPLGGLIACRRRPGKLERGERQLSQALALADELGMRPLAARCHGDLGVLYRHAGKRERAARHRAIATTMYRELGMCELGGDRDH